MDGQAFGGALSFVLLIALPLLFAITLHEAAHGWVARLFGDQTAQLLGRVSLNPARHIDPVGTIILPLGMIFLSASVGGVPFIFGWAKPVPVNWANLSKPRLGKACVAFSGSAANFLMAVMWGMIAAFAGSHLNNSVGFAQQASQFFYLSGKLGVTINVVLGFLNLLPIPPLDGARVVSAIIPPRWDYYYSRLEPYGIWILLALLLFGGLSYILFPFVSWLSGAIFAFFQL